MRAKQFFSPRFSLIVGLALLLGTSSGCSTMSEYLPSFSNFGVYRIDVNQGNYLTKDMVEKLKVGQTRQQVRAALGTPILDSAFHADRWDYVYSYRKSGEEVENRKFAVYFEDDKLARWEGDEAPVSAIEQNRIASAREVPDTEKEGEGFFSWLWGLFGGD
ncbi:MAG: outer membrane protein assembly factor BamE [Burkholderiales bacterium]|jgi:outer membrane protein assembly factor BamE|nr:outer membrane protein assembly factor BamE [Burkholderiales bacterium]